MESVIVLGGGGFIGSHMVKYLKDKGHAVTAVDIQFPDLRKQWWSLADDICIADLRVKSTVEDLIQGYDWVFHFAADMGGVGYFTAHDYYPYLNNQQMNLNVLQAVEKTGARLFFSSSACAYPTHLQQDPKHPAKLSENMLFPANSDQMYGWDKLMMTMLCQRAPIDARVGIFHTIYGPGQESEGERAKFPPTIVKKALDAVKTGKLELWGDGKQKRTYLYINDALEKIYRIMTMPYSGPVNVAGDECVSVTETAKLVCWLLGISPDFIYTSAKPSGVLGRDVDNSLFLERYRYKNQFTLEHGFRHMIEHAFLTYNQ